MLENLELGGGAVGTRWAEVDSRSAFEVGVMHCVSREAVMRDQQREQGWMQDRLKITERNVSFLFREGAEENKRRMKIFGVGWGFFCLFNPPNHCLPLLS